MTYDTFMCGYSIKSPNKIQNIKPNNKSTKQKLDETKRAGQTNPNPFCIKKGAAA